MWPRCSRSRPMCMLYKNYRKSSERSCFSTSTKIVCQQGLSTSALWLEDSLLGRKWSEYRAIHWWNCRFSWLVINGGVARGCGIKYQNHPCLLRILQYPMGRETEYLICVALEDCMKVKNFIVPGRTIRWVKEPCWLNHYAMYSLQSASQTGQEILALLY